MKSLTSRTSLITAVAVAGVLVAGTAAIAANIGILNSTNDSSIGSLSATDDLVENTSTTLGTTTTTTAPTTTTTSVPEAPASESYAIDDAGIVTLSSASGRLTLVAAVPEPGWTVTSSQPDPTKLDATFTNGTRTLVFSASLGLDGVVTADIVEPVEVMGAPAAAPAAAPATSSPTTTIDDDHDDDGYEDDGDEDDDDDGYEDDGDEDDDHDDDDDHDEYEGADDDD